jgi:hypothetical protein
MNLPKPWTKNIVTYSNAIAHQSIPEGANQHFDRIRMKAKRDPMKPGVEFNMKGPCRGNLHDVIALGIKMAEEALVSGDKVFAGTVMKRIQTVQMQYEIDRLTRQLAREQTKVG